MILDNETLFSQNNVIINLRSQDNESNMIGLRLPSHMTSCQADLMDVTYILLLH